MNMKFNKLSKTLSMTALTAAMAVAPAINVFAAPEDIIDTTKKASLVWKWNSQTMISMFSRMPKETICCV